MKFLQLDELLNGLEKDKKSLDNYYMLDKDYLYIKMESGSIYNIDIEELQNPIKAIGWLRHMMEKTWFRENAIYPKGFFSMLDIILNNGKYISTNG